ncbi:MAG TPA: cupin domain-containing protein [Candidatus Didemnitutus sp.]|nr:cupin domain-containing protein [Candidatus Didemnitutus sp.]
MRATVAETFARIPIHGGAQAAPNPRWPKGEPFVTAMQHGSMSVELYAPRGQDEQTPHRRDEIYVIVSGSGQFVHGVRRDPFGPGDVLFAPAFMEHRFEDFTDDFCTWVIFYGPEGGEI